MPFADSNLTPTDVANIWIAIGTVGGFIAVVLGSLIAFQQLQINSLKKAVAECEKSRKEADERHEKEHREDQEEKLRLSVRLNKQMHLRIQAEQTVTAQKEELRIYKLRHGSDVGGETEFHENTDS